MQELESNIILRSRVMEPEGNGFGTIKKNLVEINAMLNKFEAKTWNIRFAIDQSAVNALGHSIVTTVEDAAKRAAKTAESTAKASSTAASAIFKRVRSETIRYGEDTEKFIEKNIAIAKARSRGSVTETSQTQIKEDGGIKSENTTTKTRILQQEAIEKLVGKAATDEALAQARKKFDALKALSAEMAAKQKAEGRNVNYKEIAEAASQKLSYSFTGEHARLAHAVKRQEDAQSSSSMLSAASAKSAEQAKFNERLKSDAAKAEQDARSKSEASAKWMIEEVEKQDRQGIKLSSARARANKKKMDEEAKFNERLKSDAAKAEQDARSKSEASAKWFMDEIEKQERQAAAAQKKQEKARQDFTKNLNAQQREITKNRETAQKMANEAKSIASAQAAIDSVMAGIASGQGAYRAAGSVTKADKNGVSTTNNFTRENPSIFGNQDIETLSINADKGTAVSTMRRRESLAERARKAELARRARKAERDRMAMEELSLYRQGNIARANPMSGLMSGITGDTDADIVMYNERQNKAEKLTKGRRKYKAAAADLESEGYKKSGSEYNEDTGVRTNIFTKGMRTGFAEYEHSTVRVSTATGKMKESLVTGAKAARLIGDSFVMAAEKIGLWLSATGAIFSIIRGFQELSRVTIELESATILLARVSKGLGDTFAERSGPANRIKSDLLDIGVLTGSAADQSMRAAAIFARSGQTQKEIVESTTASMIAAKIAEMDLVEASELLSASYLQFNMKASSTIGIVNDLNMLSNSYRVTTDDLFQSISRSGAIIAAQNGRLTELAAITATTSQATARSGAEIGNAIKTIASNLERVDTKAMLFSKLKMGTSELNGMTKSYSQTLLELSLATESMSQSEQNQIGIQIAGVRQRNQLLNQMKQIVESIKAENMLVFNADESNTAIGELRQNFDTLQSHMERLRASAVRMASETSGPIQVLAKDMMTLTTMAIHMLGAFDGIPASASIALAAIVALGVGLEYLWKTQIKNESSFLRINFAMIQTQITAYMTANSTGVLSASMNVLAASTWAALAPLLPFIAAAGAVALVVHGVATAYSELALKEQAVKQLQDSLNESTDKAIEKEERRAKAYIATADAISVLLNKAQEYDKVGNSDRAQERRNDAKEILKTAGINKNIDFDDPSKAKVELRREGIKAEIKAKLNQINYDALNYNKLQQSSADRISKLNPEYKKYAQDKLDAADGDQEAMKRAHEFETMRKFVTSESRGKITGMERSRFASNEPVIKAYLEEQAEIKKINERFREQKEVLGQLQAKKAFNTQATAEEELALLKNVKAMHDMNMELSFFDKHTKPIRSSMMGGESSAENIQAEIAMTQGLVSENEAIVKSLKDRAMTAKEVLIIDKQYTELAVEGRNKILELETKLSQARISESKQVNQKRNNDSYSLQAAAANASMQQEMLANPEKFTGESSGYLSLQRRREIAAAQVKGMMAENESIMFGNSRNSKEKQQENLGVVAANNLSIQERMNEMADLEIQKAQKLFEMESNIADQRKRSADEAKRALGILSEEDKMRVIAQAAHFKKNPDKFLSVEDQMFMGAQDVSIGRQFHGKHFSNSFRPERSPMAGLMGPGFGTDFETERSARDAARIRAGRIDEQVINDSVNEAGNNRAVANRNAGGFGIQPNRNTVHSADTNGRISAQFDIRPQLIDLAPMNEAYLKILTEHTAQQIAQARSAMWEAFQRDKANKTPQTTVQN